MPLPFNYRRRIELLVIFFLVLFTFASYKENTVYWLQWLVLVISVASLTLVDFIFLNAGDFIYDPSYQSWTVLTGQTTLSNYD